MDPVTFLIVVFIIIIIAIVGGCGGYYYTRRPGYAGSALPVHDVCYLAIVLLVIWIFLHFIFRIV